jgi:GNAT superfamily N-acetyltransferase
MKETTTTYLEMRSKPEFGNPAPPPGRIRIERVMEPPLPFYREMYQAIGGRWHWFERMRLSDPQLKEIIQDPDISILALRMNGRIIGFAELDRRQKPDIELKYFGLLPEYIGKGFGRYFLNGIVQKAWESSTSRLWLHTCDRDHPGALAFYQKSGFVVYQVERKAPEKS